MCGGNVGYKNNFDRPLISREKAKDIISDILKYEESIKKVQGLGKVSVNQLIESELEAKFLEEIENYTMRHYQSKMKPIFTSRQRTGFLLKFGEQNYELEQQVDLGESDGVSIVSRADFVFYPVGNKGLKPIVVFADGFTYHRDRIGRDSAQRMALMISTKYIVWSLTWEDVEQFSQKKPEYTFVNFLTNEYMNMKNFKSPNMSK